MKFLRINKTIFNLGNTESIRGSDEGSCIEVMTVGGDQHQFEFPSLADRDTALARIEQFILDPSAIGIRVG